MANEGNGLVETTYKPRRNTHKRESFNQGEARRTISEILDRNSNYVLIQTIANPDAIEALGNYVGFRRDMHSPWEIRTKREEDNPKYCPGAKDSNNGLRLTPDLINEYLAATKEISKEIFGKDHYAQFPLVQKSGVHSLSVPLEARNWPVIHIVKDAGEEQFQNILYSLNQKTGQEVLKRMEAPQNYKLGEIQTLAQLGIDPLLMESRTWKVNGETLADAVNFLVPFTLVHGDERFRPDED